MNIENRTFVDDMSNKINQTRHLHKNNHKIETQKNELRDKFGEIVTFINKNVIGSNTSSLIRTNVEVPIRGWTPHESDIYEIITFNKNGMGTLKQSKSGRGYYGTNMSEVLTEDEFIKYCTDETIRNKIIDSLDKTNNRKMKKIMEKVFENIPTLEPLKKISQHYRETRYSAHTIDEPVLISVPKIEYTSTNMYKSSIKAYKIQQVLLFTTNKLILVKSGASQKDIDVIYNDKYYDNRWENTGTYLNYETIEGNLIAIQIADELDKIYKEALNTIEIDKNKTLEVESKIHSEFMIYMLAKELKEVTQ